MVPKKYERPVAFATDESPENPANRKALRRIGFVIFGTLAIHLIFLGLWVYHSIWPKYYETEIIRMFSPFYGQKNEVHWGFHFFCLWFPGFIAFYGLMWILPLLGFWKARKQYMRNSTFRFDERKMKAIFRGNIFGVLLILQIIAFKLATEEYLLIEAFLVIYWAAWVFTAELLDKWK